MPEAVALVTGGSRGIGRAIAVALATRGHPVAVNYVSDEDAAKETLAEIHRVGGEGVAAQGDVARGDSIAACFDLVEDALGPVGILVNNAGVRRDGLALSMSDDAWRQVLDVNLYGTFACSRRALRGMLRARWGRIVNIASVAGLNGSPGQANYSAAKAGVIGFTRTLAMEVAAKSITVNAVAPGLVDTDLTTGLTEKQRDDLIARIPTRRSVEPSSIASLVAWLASEEAASVTGSVFTIDGGMTA